MNVKQIKEVLDSAMKARAKGLPFVPLFAGDAGIGKSQACQQWAKEQQKDNPEFGFIDVRLAYREGPDLVGFPFVFNVNGEQRTINALPEFWPTKGQGLLLFEEPNRAHSSVMNCLMQILTDRAVDKYKLPEGWIIAGCINPEGGRYDVNAMDTALKNRFVTFDVLFNHKIFVDYARKSKWNSKVVAFLEAGIWQFASPDQVGQEGKFISSRNFEQLNSAEEAGLADNEQLYKNVIVSILGNKAGSDYLKFVNESNPVLVEHIFEDKKKALESLAAFSDEKAYRGDMVTTTIDSIVGYFESGKNMDPVLFAEVCLAIPAEQVWSLGEKVYATLESRPDGINTGDEFIIEVYKNKKLKTKMLPFKEAGDVHENIERELKAQAEAEQARNKQK